MQFCMEIDEDDANSGSSMQFCMPVDEGDDVDAEVAKHPSAARAYPPNMAASAVSRPPPAWTFRSAALVKPINKISTANQQFCMEVDDDDEDGRERTRMRRKIPLCAWKL